MPAILKVFKIAAMPRSYGKFQERKFCPQQQ